MPVKRNHRGTVDKSGTSVTVRRTKRQLEANEPESSDENKSKQSKTKKTVSSSQSKPKRRKKLDKSELSDDPQTDVDTSANRDSQLESSKPKQTKTAKSNCNSQHLKSAKSEKQIKDSESLRQKILIGCHVSAAGGVHNAVANAVASKARCFALFLTNQRQWNSKPLEDDIVVKFREALVESGISANAVVPHGIYLMNCSSPDDGLISKSRAKLTEEVKRCERLGIKFYNFHPGSTLGKIERPDGIQRIADSINATLKDTEDVTLLIENMSGQKNTIGGTFEDLRDIISRVKDKSRVGVCLDTCHMFAAGFDIRTQETYQATMARFDATVGFQYLKAFHLNDSKAGLGSHLDRHEDIGKGAIGLEGFRHLVNDKRLVNIPMILETPGYTNYDKQIHLLYSLIK